MRKWQPMKTLNLYPQLFWGGRLNQLGRPVSAPDPVSGWGQPIRDAPVHLMHCFPPADSRQAWTGLDHHTGALVPSRRSDCQPIRCVISLSHVAWQINDFAFLFCLFLCSLCEHICRNLLPLPHSTLQSYQQTSVTPILDSPSSRSSTMGTVLQHQL